MALPKHTDAGPVPEGEPSAEDSRAALVKILASKPFRRSERLREFLSYISRCALEDPSRPIREADIGSHVFGRPPGYDTNIDNIVRVNASELRHRLEEYFGGDGSSDPVIIEIPRGGYSPRFRLRESAVVEPTLPAPTPSKDVPPPITPETPHPPRARGAFRLYAVCALMFLLGGAGAWLLIPRPSSSREPERPPTLSRFWGPMLGGERPADIIMADSSLSLYQDLTNERISLDQYVNRAYLANSPTGTAIPKPYLDMLMNRKYTSLADVLLLHRITSIAGPAERSRINIYFARDYPAANLSKSNVIILGGKRANPWAEPFDKSLHFRVQPTGTEGVVAIRILDPRPGEQAVSTQQGRTKDVAESHAIIAFLPGGQGGSVLLLAGTGMDGTLAAGEFMTSERWMKELASRLGGTRTGRFPYFEVLLYARRLGSGVIGETQIRAVRAH